MEEAATKKSKVKKKLDVNSVVIGKKSQVKKSQTRPTAEDVRSEAHAQGVGFHWPADQEVVDGKKMRWIANAKPKPIYMERLPRQSFVRGQTDGTSPQIYWSVDQALSAAASTGTGGCPG